MPAESIRKLVALLVRINDGFMAWLRRVPNAGSQGAVIQAFDELAEIGKLALTQAASAGVPFADANSAIGDAMAAAEAQLDAIHLERFAGLDSGTEIAGEPADLIKNVRTAADALQRMVCWVESKRPQEGKKVKEVDAATDAPKGVAGRRGYPAKALKAALALRKKNPTMKAKEIRALCLKKFDEDDLPPDSESFRRWMNRQRKIGRNRAN